MSQSEAWSGRTGFILATIGSAVGLGSIWKFPYEVGANGGSAFLLFYLAGLALIVIPLMLAEMAIGRRGRGDPATSIAAVAAQHGADRRRTAFGVLGVISSVLILSFYSVIGGWAIRYALHTAPEQMQWVKDALLNSLAPFKIVANGNQVLNPLCDYEALVKCRTENDDLLAFIEGQPYSGRCLHQRRSAHERADQASGLDVLSIV